jgi:hypothetical protein
MGRVSTSVCLCGTELDSDKSDSGVRLTLLWDTGVWLQIGTNPTNLGLNMDQYSALSRVLWNFLANFLALEAA